MADKDDTEPKKKGGFVKKFMIGLAAIVVLGGAGAAGGFLMAGQLGIDAGPPVPELPELVTHDGDTVPAANAAAALASGPAAYKATYYPIEGGFTSNLQGSDGFAQMSVAIATYYDERVVQNIEAHETALRSAMLMTIAEQDREMLVTQQGKATLQGLLTTAINDVLEQKTGFGGVDNVYFTSFVIQ